MLCKVVRIALYGCALSNVCLPPVTSREVEADPLGLMLMADSCYDPHGALHLWCRILAARGGAKPKWFGTKVGTPTPIWDDGINQIRGCLSVGSSLESRIENIRGWLPEAEARVALANCGGIHQPVDLFRRALSNSRRWGDRPDEAE